MAMKGESATLPEDVWTYLAERHLEPCDISHLSMTCHSIRRAIVSTLFRGISLNSHHRSYRPSLKNRIALILRLTSRIRFLLGKPELLAHVRTLEVNDWGPMMQTNRLALRLYDKSEVNSPTWRCLVELWLSLFNHLSSLISSLPRLTKVTYFNSSGKHPYAVFSEPALFVVGRPFGVEMIEFRLRSPDDKQILLAMHDKLKILNLRRTSDFFFNSDVRPCSLPIISVDLEWSKVAQYMGEDGSFGMFVSLSELRLPPFDYLMHTPRAGMVEIIECLMTHCPKLETLDINVNNYTTSYSVSMPDNALPLVKNISGPAPLILAFSRGRSLENISLKAKAWHPAYEVLQMADSVSFSTVHTLDLSVLRYLNKVHMTEAATLWPHVENLTISEIQVIPDQSSPDELVFSNALSMALPFARLRVLRICPWMGHWTPSSLPSNWGAQRQHTTLQLIEMPFTFRCTWVHGQGWLASRAPGVIAPNIEIDDKVKKEAKRITQRIKYPTRIFRLFF